MKLVNNLKKFNFFSYNFNVQKHFFTGFKNPNKALSSFFLLKLIYLSIIILKFFKKKSKYGKNQIELIFNFCKIIIFFFQKKIYN